MKIHINYTEKWDEIIDAINDAKEYLKDFDIEITHEYLDIDMSNELFYETTTSRSGLRLTKTKSIKSSVIKALGQSRNPNADFWGLMVSKSEALEKSSLNGQANYKQRVLEVYCKRTSRKRYGHNDNSYVLIHEILHLIEDSLGKNGKLHEYLATNPDNLDDFLTYLKPEKKQTWKYKHFSPTETTGHYTDNQMGTCSMLEPELLEKLDKAREIAGTSFKITSGLRSSSFNAKIGGQPNSSHLRGFAADIWTGGNTEKTAKIIAALYEVGFNRIGGKYKNFIHADCDPSLPTPRFW